MVYEFVSEPDVFVVREENGLIILWCIDIAMLWE